MDNPEVLVINDFVSQHLLLRPDKFVVFYLEADGLFTLEIEHYFVEEFDWIAIFFRSHTLRKIRLRTAFE